MPVGGFVPAFIQIGFQLSFEPIFRTEQSDEFQWDPVEYFPAVRRSACMDVNLST